MTRAIRVLLVDDEPADRALASRALTNGLEQVVIEESDSRSSLLSLLNANDYDVIITDYMLRGLNGLEVIDLVHELNADAQIIMLTGTGTEEVAIEAMKRGVADYVIKNAHHINRLPATVTHVLDRVAAEKARQKAEEKRKECEARLAHAGRLSAVGEMAAELAHELAQPLCVIDGYTVAMLNHIENNNEPPKALAENLEEIRKASERAGKLVRRMREFCRKNKGQRVPFNMNQAVSESVDFLAFESVRSGVEIDIDLDEHLPDVYGDEIQILQVLTNLLRNACEAMADTDKRDRRITVRTAADGDVVRVCVEDTGPGIPAGSFDELFDRFHTTKADGLGLGLAISQNIVEAHGGRLGAQRNDRGGATFQFTLPSVEQRLNRSVV